MRPRPCPMNRAVVGVGHSLAWELAETGGLVAAAIATLRRQRRRCSCGAFQPPHWLELNPSQHPPLPPLDQGGLLAVGPRKRHLLHPCAPGGLTRAWRVGQAVAQPVTGTVQLKGGAAACSNPHLCHMGGPLPAANRARGSLPSLALDRPNPSTAAAHSCSQRGFGSLKWRLLAPPPSHLLANCAHKLDSSAGRSGKAGSSGGGSRHAPPAPPAMMGRVRCGGSGIRAAAEWPTRRLATWLSRTASPLLIGRRRVMLVAGPAAHAMCRSRPPSPNLSVCRATEQQGRSRAAQPAAAAEQAHHVSAGQQGQQATM